MTINNKYNKVYNQLKYDKYYGKKNNQKKAKEISVIQNQDGSSLDSFLIKYGLSSIFIQTVITYFLKLHSIKDS